MEKQVIVSIILLIAGICGVGYLIQPVSNFEGKSGRSTEYYEKEFETFQWKYDKVYNDLEEVDKRFQLFKAALIQIEEFNKKSDNVKLAMNQFGDLTDEEYLSFATSKMSKKQRNPSKKITLNRPKKVNWLGKLVWDGVYNQAGCGSCWAHSAVEALEGAYAKQNGEVIQFSVQELVDCVYPTRNTCAPIIGGGLADDAYEWIIDKKHGICTKDDYPRQYAAKQFPCQKEKCKPKLTTIDTFIDVPPQDYIQTLNHLSIAPLSVEIDASQYAFKYYSSGIIKGSQSKKLNHAVLMVAYDEDEGSITVKNSWGDSWGNKGFFKVALEEGVGPLGIYLVQSYPRYSGEPVPEKVY